MYQRNFVAQEPDLKDAVAQLAIRVNGAENVIVPLGDRLPSPRMHPVNIYEVRIFLAVGGEPRATALVPRARHPLDQIVNGSLGIHRFALYQERAGFRLSGSA